MSAPSLTHSLATAPAGRTLAPLFSIFFWDGSSPKRPLGAETSRLDEICRKITRQVNSLAPPQTLSLFSQHSQAGEAAGYEGRGAHSEQNPSQHHVEPSSTQDHIIGRTVGDPCSPQVDPQT